MIRRLLVHQEQLLLALDQGSEKLDFFARQCTRLEHDVKALKASGGLSLEEERVASTVMYNTLIIVEAMQEEERDYDINLASLDEELGRLIHENRRSHQPYQEARLQRHSFSQVTRSPTTCSISPQTDAIATVSTCDRASQSAFAPISDNDNPTDHLRLWFLDHLANPYPTPSEKIELSRLTGIARNKIDSDMTNWRRRAGWTDIKDTWARGNKMLMISLIEKVEKGHEKRHAVNEAVEKMRAYLTREEEYGVGSWVHELKKMARESVNETPRKKARVNGKKVDRPMTPPPSANNTPTSSVYSTRNSAFTDPSPAGSSRSTSSSCSIPTSSSFSNFKPYSFDSSAGLPFSTSPPTPLSSSSTAGSVVGVKRGNETADPPSANTRQKLDAGSTLGHGLPTWSGPIYSDTFYTDDLYDTSSAQQVEPIVWNASAPLPEYHPHMMASMPRHVPSFALPDQYTFSFALPTGDLPPTA